MVKNASFRQKSDSYIRAILKEHATKNVVRKVWLFRNGSGSSINKAARTEIDLANEIRGHNLGESVIFPKVLESSSFESGGRVGLCAGCVWDVFTWYEIFRWV